MQKIKTSGCAYSCLRFLLPVFATIVTAKFVMSLIRNSNLSISH